MSIHYYIISIDTEHGVWELDADKESDLFPHGTILDTDTKDWHRDYSGDGEYYPEAEQLTEQISKAIKQLNEGLKK